VDGSFVFPAIKSPTDSSLMDIVYSPNVIVFFLVENFVELLLIGLDFVYEISLS
jgi:hypothetical protein